MPQCVFFGGTRVCNGSSYRVNCNKRIRKFPKLTHARQAKLKLAMNVIDELRIPDGQKELAEDLLKVVLSAKWEDSKTKNAKHIRDSVELLLADAVDDTKGRYTLVAY